MLNFKRWKVRLNAMGRRLTYQSEGGYGLDWIIVKGLVILLLCVLLELINCYLFDGKYHRLYRYLKSFLFIAVSRRVCLS